MLTCILFLSFMCGFSFVLGVAPLPWENRPKLQGLLGGYEPTPKKKRSPLAFIKTIALINKPVVSVTALSKRFSKELDMGQIDMTPEEFFFVKELLIVFFLLVS